MIEGFHIDVSSEELQRHLQERAKYHGDKSEWYKQQEKQFEDVPTATQMSNDPIKGMQEAGKRHRSKAETFTFMAKHVPAGEIFRLEQSELSNLEFVSDRHGW